MAALKYWVWLTALPGLSNRSRLLLLERYGSPEDVYYADAEELALTEGLTPGQAQLLSDKSLTRADRILADCARGDIFLLTMQDAAYPARLRDIFDPPVLLYGKGSLPLFDEEAAIAVVGARKPSPYGEKWAERFGLELAAGGALVVSGIAEGLDACALRGALKAGGPVVSVLAGGAGDAVMEVIAEAGLTTPVLCFGIPDEFIEQGTQAEIYEMLGLTPEAVEAKVVERLAQLS